MGRLRKEEMVEFLVNHLEVDEAEFKPMNYVQVQKMYQDVQRNIKEEEERPSSPAIITKPDAPKSKDFRDVMSEGGKVKVGDRLVPVDSIVVYKGKDVHQKTGQHLTKVQHPGEPGQNMNVAFERRPDIFKGLPVAVVEDWKVRAQLLFHRKHFTTNLTLGTSVTRVFRRDDYTTPLDVDPSHSTVQRMVNYLKGPEGAVDDLSELAQSISDSFFPELDT